MRQAYDVNGVPVEMPTGMEPVVGPDGQHQAAADGGWLWRNPAGEEGAMEVRVGEVPDAEPAWAAAMQRALEANRLASERSTAEIVARMLREFREQEAPAKAPIATAPVQAVFTPSTEGNTYRSKTKAAEPPRFDGSKREEAEDFVESCVIYQTLRATEFENEHTKILFAITYLEGSARQWARKYMGAVGATWKEFADELLHFFGLGNRRLETETDLVHLRQGQSSFDAYMNAFNALAARLPDVDEYSKRMIFQANLSPAWKSAITEMEMDKHASVGDFQEKCYKYAHKVVSQTKYSTGGGAHRPAPAPARAYPQTPVAVVPVVPAVSAPAAQTGGAPMEVDGARTRARVKCYNCGEFGHYSRECPRPQRNRPPFGRGEKLAAATLEPETHGPDGGDESEEGWNE